MTRAERRRRDREEKKAKTATYNMTAKQLGDAIHRGVEKDLQRAYDEGFEEGISKALTLLLTLPLEVLMDHYWPKSYEKKIPEFTNYVLEYYRKWQNDELDMEKTEGGSLGIWRSPFGGGRVT